MTPLPSPRKERALAALFAQFLVRPLAQQLSWVWLVGLISIIMVVIGCVMGYELVVKERQKTTTEYAVTGVVSGMTHHLGSALRYQDREMQQVVQLITHQGTTPLPNWNAISVVRADGQADAMGKTLSQHQRSVATAALAEHQRQDNTQLLVWGPIQNQTTGGWALQLSRRIDLENGRFYGIVLSEFDLAEVEKYFLRTRFMDDSVALLLHQDGRNLLETTDAGAYYSGRVSPLPMDWPNSSANIGDQAGSFVDSHFASVLRGADGVARHYIWNKVPNFPLFLVKGISLASIAKLTSPVRLTIITLALLASAVILIATGWMHMYVRQVNLTLNQSQMGEQILRENEERLDFALAGSGSGEWEVKLPQASLHVSRRLATVLGPPWEEGFFSQAQWQALIHPDDLPILLKALQRVATDHDQGEGSLIRVWDARIDNYKWLETMGRVRQRDATGGVVIVSGLVRDVNEQHAIQAQVLDRTAQLDAIFNLSPDAYVVFDQDRRVKYVNPAFAQMTGWRDDAMKGMSEDQFSRQLGQLCISKRPLPNISNLREAVQTNAPPIGALIELNSVPQQILWINLQLSNGPSVSQILYLRDVTHKTIVEDMKTEFLATAAHELRTPMASVVGFAEILSTHPLAPQDQLEFAQIIWRQSLHLAGILDELLDLSRIEARGGKGLVIETIDLRALLEEVISASVLPQGRDAPEVVLPPLLCKADRGKTGQALKNVLSNAYKFSGPGTAVSVTAVEPLQHTADGRSMVGLVIRDAGIGMTREQLSRVYERFYRADKTGAIPGNGLGLSITREIMGLMNGQISISSVPRQGTEVTLLFPIADAPTVMLPAPAAVAKPPIV